MIFRCDFKTFSRLTETFYSIQLRKEFQVFLPASDQKLNVALLSDEKQSQVTALSISVLG